MKRTLIFVILISTFQQVAVSQPNPYEEVVDKFYAWYVKKGYQEMKPKFIEKEGMTDLDFNHFERVHKKFNFSNRLISRSWKLYDDCRSNLSSIPYDEFKSFQDVDQFEQVNCSFQFWQWFGFGMEPFADYKITNSIEVDSNKYEVTVGLAYLEGDDLTRYIPITVERNGDGWFISEIDVSWN